LRAPTQVICLDDLLEFARDAIPDIAAWQPGRTVDRQLSNPRLTAFVRHLAARFQDRYGVQMNGAVARIASIAYSDPVTKKKVERILRTPRKWGPLQGHIPGNKRQVSVSWWRLSPPLRFPLSNGPNNVAVDLLS
jgi:hypothetical protein